MYSDMPKNFLATPGILFHILRVKEPHLAIEPADNHLPVFRPGFLLLHRRQRNGKMYKRNSMLTERTDKPGPALHIAVLRMLNNCNDHHNLSVMTHIILDRLYFLSAETNFTYFSYRNLAIDLYFM